MRIMWSARLCKATVPKWRFGVYFSDRDAPHNTSSRNEVISLLNGSDCLALLA